MVPPVDVSLQIEPLSHCVCCTIWNMLNNDFKNAIIVNDFKRLVTSWDGPSCSCSYCNICVLSSM